MRTTLTLDDDCYQRLEDERRRRGCSFRALVNESLRRGLDELQRPAPAGTPFRVRVFPGGPLPGIQWDDIEGLLDQIDGPRRR